VPIGIITNELVTKSLTYAFLEDRAGTVTVKRSRDGESIWSSKTMESAARTARIGAGKWIRVRCDNDLTFRLPCDVVPCLFRFFLRHHVADARISDPVAETTTEST
jgi:two-component sensor histidine kinase